MCGGLTSLTSLAINISEGDAGDAGIWQRNTDTLDDTIDMQFVAADDDASDKLDGDTGGDGDSEDEDGDGSANMSAVVLFVFVTVAIAASNLLIIIDCSLVLLIPVAVVSMT